MSALAPGEERAIKGRDRASAQARGWTAVADGQVDQVESAAPAAEEFEARAPRFSGTALALLAILLLGAFMRVWELNTLGFNSDEAVYAGQAAAIAQDPTLKDIFPVFRAHPLLFQYVLAVLFKFGVSDFAARGVAVLVGLLTVFLVYRVGVMLYGRTAGLWAALFVAVMPYHVVVTRQVLLDGPMTLFATAVLYSLARFGASHRPGWLYASGAMMGLTFLAKETGIILIGAVYVFLALAPTIPLRIRDIGISLVCMFMVIAPFPISIALGGGTETAKAFLIWQLFRRPNHEWPFYFLEVPPAMGILLLVVAAAGVWFLRRSRSWRETLLLAWIVVPLAFFQMWPVKGFQYLLPAAPAVALLAARAVTRLRLPDRMLRAQFLRSGQWRAVAGGLIALSLAVPAWKAIAGTGSAGFLAGAGGVPGGREAGRWIDENVPEGARFMTVGPSMANIVQFYGHRSALGLSVSPNPLHRNPSYTPISNPDLELRSGQIQYLVYDEFSAKRSRFFARSLLRYIRRYDGRVVHVQRIPVSAPGGGTVLKPVIIVYEVRP
jgi:dolichyl-phosphate-mannose-protein mannosyltransferase